MARSGYSFGGWNTQADGNGTDYAAGSTLSMGSTNVTLYAMWTISCGGSGNSCYDYSTYPIGTLATTPGSKSLTLVFANGSNGVKVWKQRGGNRILAANGLDQWSKALNVSGIGQSATDFSDANLGTANTVIEGRICPGNVYIDASNKFTTTNCLYYTPSYGAQTLNSAGNSQSSLGTIGLSGWGAAGTGNGTGAAWYEGNIQTCAAKGMRLPTLYETNANNPGYLLPTTDGTPTAWGGANGVPASAITWSATAYNNVSANFYIWNESAQASVNNYYFTSAVRCVVP